MGMHYSKGTRDGQTSGLPDIETFHHGGGGMGDFVLDPGWYWWACLPGCLPSGDPDGPHCSENRALVAARGGEYFD